MTKTEFDPDDRFAYSRQALAQIALSDIARDVAESSMVLMRTNRHDEAYEVLSRATNLVLTAQDALRAAVVWARERHTSWEDIGEAVGGISRQSAHTRYAEAEAEWKLGLVEPIIPPDRPNGQASARLPEAAYQPTSSLRYLDNWAAKHGMGEQAVSSNVPPLSMLDELGNLLDAIRHLWTKPLPRDTEDQIRLLDRKAALLDRIAAEEGRPESAELAAGARAQVAELRAQVDAEQAKAAARRPVITCPRCHSTHTEEFPVPIPNTDDYAEAARCLDCEADWGLDPAADLRCTICGGSGRPHLGPVYTRVNGQMVATEPCTCCES